MIPPKGGRERMCEAGLVWWCLSPVKMILESLKILLCNKVVFASILLLTTLPLSTLIISLSIYIHPPTTQIHYLEALSHHSSTNFEARHIWKESRHDALSLLRTKALFSLPSYLLSLSAALSSVHFTLSASHGNTPTLRSALRSLAHDWKRPFLTSIYVYAILFAFSPVPLAFAAISASTGSTFLLKAIGSALQVYLMAVLSLGLVVSIAEDRFGWDAIRVGSGLMEGRRVCGWVLSGLFVLVSGLIKSKLEELMEGQDQPPEFLAVTAVKKNTGIGVEEKAILIIWYGLVVLWSYVIMSVYYCHCRRRHPIRDPELDDDHQEDGLSL